MNGSSTPPPVPDYELLRRIGGGAYGDVWLGRSLATGILRAIKIVYRTTFADERPFLREFEGLKKFEEISRSHPSQLALFHVGRNVTEGYFYSVMELADSAPPTAHCESQAGSNLAEAQPEATIQLNLVDPGCKTRTAARRHARTSEGASLESYTPHTLRGELQLNGALAPGRVVELALALGEAVAHLHSHGLVHRDIKPANIIFVQGRPKLADIGLVTEMSDERSIVGTEGYLAPEGPGTPQSDLYALGKVLYEAVTGLDRRQFPELPADWRSRPDFDQLLELNELIAKACDPAPGQRYQSGAAMQSDLQILETGHSLKGQRTRARRWRRVRTGAAGAAALALVTVAGMLGLRKDPPIPERSKNPAAEKLYERAVYLMQAYNLPRLRQAFTNLTEAVALDPGFLDAYYKMFEVNWHDDLAKELPPHFNHDQNVAALARKLEELGPNSAQFRTVSSYIKFLTWRFDEAIDEIKRAIKADPRFVRAHGLYAWYVLLSRADAETARRAYEAAESHGYTDAIIQAHLGDPYYVEGRYDEAIACFKRAIQNEERNLGAHGFLSRTYEANGLYHEAIDQSELCELLRGHDSVQIKERYQAERDALKNGGPTAWWNLRLEEKKRTSPEASYELARLCARLGLVEDMFSYLEKCYQARDWHLIFLLPDDCWDSYRREPRFLQLLERVGFRPPYTHRRAGVNEEHLRQARSLPR